METAPDKQQAHALIERLELSQLSTARALAAAPPDDEPASEEDRRRLREGREWFAQRGGKVIPMQEVLAEFGLKPEDLPASSENAK
jgi:hypothetical protein